MPDLPRLAGERVLLRPGAADDIDELCLRRSDPTVARWWGPAERGEIAEKLAGRDDAEFLVVEVGGAVAGGIQFCELGGDEFRHAGIDVFLGAGFQGQGLGREALGLLVDYLLDERGHHRLIIDPAVANEPAVRCYRAVGFTPVGVMREYQQMQDGRWHDGLLMELLASDRSG
ncbi:MAG TPA: GNAT family protein [Gaiellales bacterium]|jgi:aminoglycoside 6'-N-acetyltransferase|nr:GNAT family protein [Gaiellales bacterium]